MYSKLCLPLFMHYDCECVTRSVSIMSTDGPRFVPLSQAATSDTAVRGIGMVLSSALPQASCLWPACLSTALSHRYRYLLSHLNWWQLIRLIDLNDRLQLQNTNGGTGQLQKDKKIKNCPFYWRMIKCRGVKEAARRSFLPVKDNFFLAC